MIKFEDILEHPELYRFKTKKELIAEYNGRLWRNSVRGTWVGEMDYLLGQQVSEHHIANNGPHAVQIDRRWNSGIEAFTLNTSSLLNYRDYSTILK